MILVVWRNGNKRAARLINEVMLEDDRMIVGKSFDERLADYATRLAFERGGLHGIKVRDDQEWVRVDWRDWFGPVDAATAFGLEGLEDDRVAAFEALDRE